MLAFRGLGVGVVVPSAASERVREVSDLITAGQSLSDDTPDPEAETSPALWRWAEPASIRTVLRWGP